MHGKSEEGHECPCDLSLGGREAPGGVEEPRALSALRDQDDLTLALDAAQGNMAAFTELYWRHTPGLSRYLRGTVPAEMRDDTALIESVSSKVWVAVHPHLGAFDPVRGSFGNWLTNGFARRILQAELRSERKHRHVPLLEEQAVPAPDVLVDVETQLTLNEMLRNLKPADKDLLYRHVVEGDTIEDLAAEWGKNASTLRGQLQRVRKQLRLALAPFFLIMSTRW